MGEEKRIILDVQNMKKSFGGLMAVNDVSFQIMEGEILGMIGPNGAGKTTVFNLISGFLKPDAGLVRFRDEVITGLRPDQISHKGLGRTFQIPQVFAKFSLLQNVMVGCFARTYVRSLAKRNAERILKAMGLFNKAEILAKKINLIDRKRLELAKAMSIEPQLILMDELMAGLTPTEIKEALVLVDQIRSSGVTIILIEHVMDVVMSVSDRVIVLHHGSKISEGSPEAVCKDKVVIDAYLGEEEPLCWR